MYPYSGNYALLVDGGIGAPSIYASPSTPTFSATQGSLCITAFGTVLVNNNGSTGWTQLASGSGAVTSVTASAPITSSGGAVPNIALTSPLAVNKGGTGTTTPSLVQGSGIAITGVWPAQTITVTASGIVSGVSATSPLASSGGTTPVISISAAPTFSTSVNSPLFKSTNDNGILGIWNAQDNGCAVNGTTNDAPALNALITAVAASGGGIVWVPPGTCGLGSAVTMKPTVSFYAPAVLFTGQGGYTGNAFIWESGSYNGFGERYKFGQVQNFSTGVGFLVQCSSGNTSSILIEAGAVAGCNAAHRKSITNNSYGIIDIIVKIDTVLACGIGEDWLNSSNSTLGNGVNFGIQGCKTTVNQAIQCGSAFRVCGSFSTFASAVTVPASGSTVAIVVSTSGSVNAYFGVGDLVVVKGANGKAFFGVVTAWVAGTGTLTVRNQAVPTTAGVFPTLAAGQYLPGTAAGNSLTATGWVHVLHYEACANLIDMFVINGNIAGTTGVTIQGGWFNFQNLVRCEGNFGAFQSDGAIVANNSSALFSSHFKLAVLPSEMSATWGNFQNLAGQYAAAGVYSGNIIEGTTSDCLPANTNALTQPLAVTTNGSTGRAAFNSGVPIFTFAYPFYISVPSLSAGAVADFYIYSPYCVGFNPRVRVNSLNSQPVIITDVQDESLYSAVATPIFGQVRVRVMAVLAMSANPIFLIGEFGS